MVGEGNVVFVRFRSGRTNSGPASASHREMPPPTQRRVELDQLVDLEPLQSCARLIAVDEPGRQDNTITSYMVTS